jgi:hypothetical protein
MTLVLYLGRDKQGVDMKLTNKRMNDDTYKLRRKVIDIIYSLKKHGVTLPRIEVRITHSHSTILGMGTMNDSQCIWITEEAVNMAEDLLVHVVCHEIGHAVFKLKHDDNCPLMAPSLHRAAYWGEILTVLK